MCGCAVELNMNSFIRARQKDTANTDEAQARTHTHTHAVEGHTETHAWFLFYLPPHPPPSPHLFALSKTLSKTFPGDFFSPLFFFLLSHGKRACTNFYCLSQGCRYGEDLTQQSPSTLPLSEDTAFFFFYRGNRLSTCGSKR